MVYKQQNSLWRVRSGDKTTKCRQLCIKNQNIEAWMVKPLSAGCVNTVGILITKLTHPRTRNTGIRNRKL